MNTKFFLILRLITLPWRLFRGFFFPLDQQHAAYRYNRLVGRFIAQQRGGKIAYDLGGYAYEVVDGIRREVCDVEIDHFRNPCCSHNDVNYSDRAYIPGSTTWSGKRPDHNLNPGLFEPLVR